jgi:hypothetical protein
MPLPPRVNFSSILRPHGGDPRNVVDPRDLLRNAQAAVSREEGKAGKTFTRTVTKRRMAGIKRAAELLDHLPGPGESLHVLLRGYFDLLNVVLATLDRLDTHCLHLRIATLSLSKRNVSELAGLLDSKTVGRVTVVTSDFQREHDADIFAELTCEMGSRGQRVAAARSHCKIVLMEMADGRKYVIEGSANLRTSRNEEQFCMSQDAALHDFYAAWHDDTVNEHEVGQNDGTQAG